MSDERIEELIRWAADPKSMDWDYIEAQQRSTRCPTCAKNGPPKSRPCAKCGHQQ